MDGWTRFGFETGNKVVHGLWTGQSYLTLLDFLAQNNFNAIRVLDPHAAHAHAARARVVSTHS
jgi:hypothetical protein